MICKEKVLLFWSNERGYSDRINDGRKKEGEWVISSFYNKDYWLETFNTKKEAEQWCRDNCCKIVKEN